MQYPFTHSQMNFCHSRSDFTTALWNVGADIRYPGLRDAEQMELDCRQLAEGDEIFRFFLQNDRNGCILQTAAANINRDIVAPVRYFDSEEEYDYFVKSAICEPFAGKEYLARIIPCRLPDCHIYLFLSHHIIMDGYGMHLIAQRLNVIRNPVADESMNGHFTDYIISEQSYKESKKFQKDLAFWEKRLSPIPVTRLFEPGGTDYTAGTITKILSRETAERVRAFCTDRETGVPAFLVAALSVYLSGITGTQHFTVGFPVLNRTTQEELHTVGLFMHILPLILQVQNRTFFDLLSEIEDSLFNLLRHQKFTQYDILQADFMKSKHIGSLFDVTVDYQPFFGESTHSVRYYYPDLLSTALEIHFLETSEKEIETVIRYRKSLFTETDICNLFESLCSICKTVMQNPEIPVREIPLYANRKLSILKGETVPVPAETLYSVFEKTALKNPEKICLQGENCRMTYRDFMRKVEQTDMCIRHITHGNKSIIAVLTDRSAEMYTAIYGIIRGGNAYLPIATDTPQQRTEYILKNSNAAAVLTQEPYIQTIQDIPCINMTDILSDSVSYFAEKPQAEPEDTAYVIYTSGSTGQPKGAKISHRSTVNRIAWMNEAYPLPQDGVILQKTPYTFDVSVWEIFRWAFTGASLAFMPKDTHFNPSTILDYCEKYRVTDIHFVPSVFRIFIQYIENNPSEREKFFSVKHLFLSGEALTADLIHRFYNIFSHEKTGMHNLYGPTECAVDVTHYDCHPEDTDPIPIGKPIYNTQCYITDEQLRMLPVGTEGELCIGGMNVGQGYLHNIPLTNEKFIKNPFGDGMIYRTGDRAVQTEDGQILYRGRRDSQTKINGIRVEAGEIEEAMQRIPGVEQACAVFCEKHGKKRIMVFYNGVAMPVKDIKEHLSALLPPAIMPSEIIFLNELPLNTSGKIDRKQIQSIAEAMPETVIAENEKPETEIQELLCRAFAGVLQIPEVGLHTDFLQEGGTSLEVMQLLSCDDHLQALTPSDILANPTPEQLAAILTEKRSKKTEILQCLYTSKGATKSLVLFPYAGGNAASFTALLGELKKQSDRLNIYVCGRIYDESDIKKASGEVRMLADTTKVYFYSHCVGCTTALRILQSVNKNGQTVQKLIAGGSIPNTVPKNGNNPWRRIPDGVILRILRGAGLHTDGIGKTEMRQMLSLFRHDTDAYNRFFASLTERIPCTVTVLVSPSDVFTRHCGQAKPTWEQVVTAVEGVYYMPGKSHYFHTEYPAVTAEMICLSM